MNQDQNSAIEAARRSFQQRRSAMESNCFPLRQQFSFEAALATCLSSVSEYDQSAIRLGKILATRDPRFKMLVTHCQTACNTPNPIGNGHGGLLLHRVYTCNAAINALINAVVTSERQRDLQQSATKQ